MDSELTSAQAEFDMVAAHLAHNRSLIEAGDWGSVVALVRAVQVIYHGIEDMLASIDLDIEFDPFFKYSIAELKNFNSLAQSQFGHQLDPETVLAVGDTLMEIFPQFVDAIHRLEASRTP